MLQIMFNFDATLWICRLIYFHLTFSNTSMSKILFFFFSSRCQFYNSFTITHLVSFFPYLHAMVQNITCLLAFCFLHCESMWEKTQTKFKPNYLLTTYLHYSTLNIIEKIFTSCADNCSLNSWSQNSMKDTTFA